MREISDPAVAVVDDDPAITEQICSYLNRTGFIAKGYTSYRSFLAELKSASFDAVIIDWLLDGITARYPIEEIISSAPAPLVYLLTGKIATGEASEVEMAEIIQKYDISALEKPLRLPWLVADLNRRLNQRRD
ncbi:response regulator [Burkholderia gladioli]|uniref:response regulator n=1 Tax=Burkholderia gladioli TaxID=28095 RepID=UPI002FE38D53